MTAHQLAHWALLLEGRMQAWLGSLTPDWGQALGICPEWVTRGHDARFRRLSAQLFVKHCGPMPSPRDVGSRAGSLAVLPPEALRARLCAVALLSRPGVIRACVSKPARLALQACLGPAFGSLQACGAQGAVPPAEQASWTPLQWAWVGYKDLLQAQAWPHGTLARLARMALPASEHGLPDGELARPLAQDSAPWEQLETHFGVRPTC